MHLPYFKTDPANLDYEIISGARRQEKRFKAEENGTVIPDEKVGIIINKKVYVQIYMFG